MPPTIDIAEWDRFLLPLEVDVEATCPVPIADYPNVLLAHGGGGKLMGDLITHLFIRAFDNPHLNAMHDGALLPIDNEGQLAFSTDSYVVDPLFFPGGDIGSLAVNGTVNDLAMCGARPQYLSAGFVIEEGFSMEHLWKIAQSMAASAAAAGVQVVTGDTKVVDRGKGDGLFINTAGIGIVPQGVVVAPDRVQAGDAIILSGDIGRHGMAIMAQRQGLAFESTIESDCAPLNAVVQDLLNARVAIRCMRDLTRGGLASALVEIAQKSGRQIEIEERAIPVIEEVRGACEILGLDPLYVANEGRFAVFVPEAEAEHALSIMRGREQSSGACRIGRVGAKVSGTVVLESSIGVRRIVDLFSGEQLPRIC